MKAIKTLSLALLAVCSFSFSSQAQEETKKADTDPLYYFSPAFEFLRSTHGNFFNGPSFKVSRNLPGGFTPGIGIGYATTELHHDNGLLLHNVKLLPVYANLTYDFAAKSKFEPFVETSVGMTFMRYKEATEENPTAITSVKENGLYLYGGFGLRYKVTKHFSPYVAAGFKGYKNTLNDLDINPHGITFQAGVRF